MPANVCKHWCCSSFASKCRKRQPAQPKVAAHSAWLDQALEELGAELGQTLHASPLWREGEALRRSVPDVGPTVAPTLLAHLPELGLRRGEARRQLGGPGATNSLPSP